MTDKEVKLNWYAIAESGASITAIHNLREHYKNIESENEQLKEQNRKMENCLNCEFYEEKKYQACIDRKKNNTRCCAFYKMEAGK